MKYVIICIHQYILIKICLAYLSAFVYYSYLLIYLKVLADTEFPYRAVSIS